MQMDSMLVELEAYTINANIVKTVVLDKLVLDNIISEEQYNKYNNDYHIIIIKPSWFKNIFSNIKGYIYKYIKLNDDEKSNVSLS